MVIQTVLKFVVSLGTQCKAIIKIWALWNLQPARNSLCNPQLPSLCVHDGT